MNENLKAIVRAKYGEAATRAASDQSSSCCNSSNCCGTTEAADPIISELYGKSKKDSVLRTGASRLTGMWKPHRPR